MSTNNSAVWIIFCFDMFETELQDVQSYQIDIQIWYMQLNEKYLILIHFSLVRVSVL